MKSDVVFDSDYLEKIVQKGCRLFIWDRHTAQLPKSIPHFKFVYKSENFGIYIPNDSVE